MHKREVCIIQEIRKNYFQGKDYYSISPITDSSLIINVPVDSPVIKDVISSKEAERIIKEIPNVEILASLDKYFETVYKELLETEDLLDLVRIIKTTYIRNKNRVENGKKIGDKDNAYFEKAEKLLYTSLSIALGISYEECKECIIKKLKEEGKKEC